MNTRTKPRKPCAIAIEPCECIRHDAYACQGQQHNTTPFNAGLCYGHCLCLCHQNEQGQQVSEQVWQSRKSLAERRGGKR